MDNKGQKKNNTQKRLKFTSIICHFMPLSHKTNTRWVLAIL